MASVSAALRAVFSCRYLAAPAYVLGMMFCTVGAYMWQPYTGKGPPGTYVKADKLPPAPPIAEIGPKIQTRFVTVERIKPPVKPRKARHESR
jgi:hypothetical protein